MATKQELEKYKKNLAGRIRYSRTVKGYSAEEASKISGISLEQIENLEAGNMDDIEMGELFGYVEAIGGNMMYILGNDFPVGDKLKKL